MKINIFNNLKLGFSSQKEEEKQPLPSNFYESIKDDFQKNSKKLGFSANPSTIQKNTLPLKEFYTMISSFLKGISETKNDTKKIELFSIFSNSYENGKKSFLQKKHKIEGLTNEESQNFLNDMFHEGRNAFAVIQLPITKIRRKKIQQLPENFNEVCVKELNNIVDFLNKYQFFVDKRLYRPDFPKREILKYSLELAEGKTKKLSVEGAALLDETNLKIKNTDLYSVMSNVIGNAAKYSKGEGNISVKFKKVINKKGKECLRFSVTDNGIGIPQKDMTGITKGERASNTGEIQGTGYGLKRVAKIMANCLSPVKIHSHENIGTQIICDIPVK